MRMRILVYVYVLFYLSCAIPAVYNFLKRGRELEAVGWAIAALVWMVMMFLAVRAKKSKAIKRQIG